MPAKEFENMGVLQAKVMDALWDLGEGTVHQIRDELAKVDKDIAYTSVLSTLQKLEKAGWVKHRSQGRMYAYSPTKNRKQTLTASLKKIVKRIFKGNPMKLVHHVLEVENVSQEEISALKKLLSSKGSKKPDA
jgi:BlaI family transcriptional regulator, penicillinase repressor